MRQYISASTRENEVKFETIQKEVETKFAEYMKTLKIIHKKEIMEVKQNFNNYISTLKQDIHKVKISSDEASAALES